MNDKTRIKNTFNDLRKIENKIVVDQKQDNRAFNREGNIDGELSLRWSGEAKDIIEALIDNGLDVKWSGFESDAIIVSHAEDSIYSRFSIDNVVCEAKKRELEWKEEAYLAKIIRSVNEKKIRKCLTM